MRKGLTLPGVALNQLFGYIASCSSNRHRGRIAGAVARWTPKQRYTMKKRTKRGGGRSAETGSSRVRNRENVRTSDNDHLAGAFADLVPEKYIDSDRFFSMVQWNIEWFGATKSAKKDARRFGVVVDVLEALNADLFVFQEVAGPSDNTPRPGALEAVAQELSDRGAGDYAVAYTTIGGEQRVAFMWDRDFLRLKDEVQDLYHKGEHTTADGKDAFAGRTPLYGYFTTRLEGDGRAGSNKFDFQVLGVHLKAMAEGAPQRLASAKVLADWLTNEAPRTDADAMITGDWNASPDDKCWKPFHDLEGDPTKNNGSVVFRRINDPSDFSYLWLRNRKEQYVSRIDLTAMSMSSYQKVAGYAAEVVRWKPIAQAIEEAGDMTSSEVRLIMEQIKEYVSDHLPTASRFYIK